MPDLSFMGDVLVFLAAAVIVAQVCRWLRTSVVLGYLVAGVAIGPHGLGAIDSSATTQGIAELGVLFLLFAIGLEMTIDRLKVIRRFVLGLGGAQVLISAIVFAAFAVWIGQQAPASAVLIGGGLALSSTAVVLQLLSEQGQLATRAGRIAFSILLLQDLAVLPLLALVPSLSQPSEDTALTVVWTLIKGGAAVAVIYAIGRLVLRPLFHMIALGRNADMFTATTLLALLGVSWATHEMGLSLAMGGFMAGLLLAETEYRHQVAADIAPFRNLLLGLFFMTVGMGLDLGLVAAEPVMLAAAVAGILVAKALILFGLCLAARQPLAVAAQVALLLPQCGEFGFILFGAAAAAAVVPATAASLLIAAIAVTMVLTPFLAVLGGRTGQWLETRPGGMAEEIRQGTEDLRNHVIIAGFGRVGQSVAKTLAAADVPYVAVEFEPTRVAEARAQGLPVFYGDASRPEVLHAAGAERARAAVIIMDNAEAVERIVYLLRQQCPAIRIFVRARDNGHRRRLHAAGADGIVHETFEMSLNLGGAVLRSFGTAEERIEEIIRAHRAEDYALLADIIHPSGDSPAARPQEAAKPAEEKTESTGAA